MRRLAPVMTLLAVIAVACSGSGATTTTARSADTGDTGATSSTTTTVVGVTSPPADPDRAVVDGDSVGVFYTGTLDDGEQFDSNVGGAPLTFVVGSGQVIPGFDDAVRGLEVGQSITVRIEPADAYGETNPDLIIEVPRDGTEPDFQVGDQVSFSGQPVTILEIREDVIVIDANPDLAGEALTFEIELVSIG